ncbi:uncharacterized protein [Rutidosis leptorrhynchoides]|uniref:uncharacterized protein n=1 Tax=Rutidosis leptorrhynchoides TaxID=125765 RepID=UPI003A98E339
MTITSAAATIMPDKMGGGDPVPIEIGARGTVGNLVMKEIEYFRRLESNCGNEGIDHTKCSTKSTIDQDEKHRYGNGGGTKFWPSFRFLNISWRKGKRKSGGSGRFLPKMCSLVDVAESRHHNHHRVSKVPSFSYLNLKDDINQYEV